MWNARGFYDVHILYRTNSIAVLSTLWFNSGYFSHSKYVLLLYDRNMFYCIGINENLIES